MPKGGNYARENAMLLDPNRQKIAKDMSVMPGGPENNNPMNVTDINNTPIQSTSIYGDYKQNYPQMGTGMVNPMMVRNSMTPGYLAPGQRLNQNYGRYQQPDVNGNSPMADMMESSRLAMRADSALPRGNMGLAGSATIPGGLPPDMPGSTGQPLMPGSPGLASNAMMPIMDSGAGMIPGSTPQKMGQKKKGGKK